ncbi:MAG: transketolase family protein, partial [Clostridiaceae bacterium]|nr:transketolase family protein [Clostridiaceae bacterium]
NICVPFRKHGVMDQFGQVGDQAYLQEVFGLTAENLIGEAKKVLSMK